VLVSGQVHVLQSDVVDAQDSYEDTPCQVDYKSNYHHDSQLREPGSSKHVNVLLYNSNRLGVVIHQAQNASPHVEVGSAEDKGDEFDEHVVVTSSNAVVNIRAVMVEVVNTSVASFTVLGVLIHTPFADFAFVRSLSRGGGYVIKFALATISVCFN